MNALVFILMVATYGNMADVTTPPTPFAIFTEPAACERARVHVESKSDAARLFVAICVEQPPKSGPLARLDYLF